MKKLFLCLAVLGLSVAQLNAAEKAPTKNIVETAVAAGSFNTLAAALKAGGLIEALSSDGPFTVFAPFNNAFLDLLDELGVNSLNDIDEPTLSAVLSYHVVVGANQTSINLSDGMEFNTASGSVLTYSVSDSGQGTLLDNNARISNIIAVDVQADNGIIHAIDKVVLP